MTLFVGIDGGGTRTRAVITDADGVELARVEGSACALDPAAPEHSAEVIVPLVRTLQREAGTEVPVAALWAGVAGAGRERSRAALESRLASEELARNVTVGTDIAAAFFGAFEDGPGVLLISGTGSIAMARSAEGADARAGGWGRGIGDEGSGFELGLKGLRAICRASDGTGPPTALESALLPETGAGDARGLIGWIAGARPAQVAALAPIVCQLAEEGDEVALGLVTESVAALARMAGVVVDQLAPWPATPHLMLEGGMVRPGSALRARAVLGLADLPVRIREDAVDAAMGAARMAAGLA